MSPAIDHGILSPSGNVSKRAERAAKERMRRELFGDGLEYPSCPQESKRDSLLRRAKELRELAARGMSPRKYAREAERLEQEAENAA